LYATGWVFVSHDAPKFPHVQTFRSVKYQRTIAMAGLDGSRATAGNRLHVTAFMAVSMGLDFGRGSAFSMRVQLMM
jgi:hypothetical protein